MAQIPKYSRRPSESSAVGTPGVDTSGAIISNALSSVADTAIKVRAQKQQIVETSKVNRRLVDFDLESHSISQQVQQELSENSPEEVRDEVKRRLGKRSEELGKDIKSPEAKRALNDGLYKIVGTQSLKAFDSSNKLQSARAAQDVVGSLNTLSTSVSSIFADPALTIEEKMAQFDDKIALGGKVLDASPMIFNPKEYKTLRANLPKMLAKGAVLGAIQNDPDFAIDMLKSGEFDEALGAEEKEKLSAKAVTVKETMKKKLEVERKDTEQKNVLDVATNFLENKLTLDSIEELVTSGAVPPEAGAAFEMALFNPKEWSQFEKNPANRPSDKGRILVQILDSINQDPKKLGDVVMRGVNEYNEGRLDFVDLAWVIKTAQGKKENPDDGPWDEISNAFNVVANFAGPASIPKLIAQFNDQETPTETARRVVQDNVRGRNPKLSLMDEMPNSVMDAFGLVKRIWLGELGAEPAERAKSEDYASTEK